MSAMNHIEGLNKKIKQWKPFETMFNIRRESPEFRRCCFCLPLRRGLITWGYIKMVADVLSIALMVYFMVHLGMFAVAVVEIVFLVTDVSFNIVLIVGCHQKNVKLLKISYVYSIVWMCLMIIGFCWLAYIDIRLAYVLLTYSYNYWKMILSIVLPGLCVQFVMIFVHLYILLLIRSEVRKLQDQTLEMQYTNPLAAEANCTLTSATHRMETQDVACASSEDMECGSKECSSQKG